MNEYKTFKELKEELGDKFEEYMYKANIELLNIINEAKEYIESRARKAGVELMPREIELLKILNKGDD